MKKTTTVILSALAVLVAVIGISSFVAVYKAYANVVTDGSSVMRKVRSPKNQVVSSSIRSEFDLNAILTGEYGKFNTYICRGTVTDISNYEVSWTDDNNEPWGPYRRTIITIKADKEYHGKAASENGTVKILTTDQPGAESDAFLNIKKGGQYIFVNCWLLDKKYQEYNATNNPESFRYDLSMKEADAIMGGIYNSVFAIEDGHVFAYQEYFAKSKIPMNAFKISDSTAAIDSFNLNASDTGEYLALPMSVFEKTFSELLANHSVSLNEDIGNL